MLSVINKKPLLFLIAGFFIWLSSLVAAQSLDYALDLDQSRLNFSRNANYDLIQYDEDRATLAGDPGDPWLPAYDVWVFIPDGKAISSFDAKTINTEDVLGSFRILPAQQAQPISDPAPQPFTTPNPHTYSKVDPVHEKPARLISTMTIRGHQIAVVQIQPIAYIPASGKVFFNKLIHIHFDLKDAPGPALAASSVRYKKAESLFQNFVRQSVINPGVMPQAAKGPSFSPTDPNDVKYLLITNSTLIDEFQPLLDWKTKKGVPALAMDVADIYTNYAGADNQEKIKACIKYFAENHNTVWVALAGDDNIIPDRDCYGQVNGTQYTEKTIPTDLYYAGLDDMNWNDDGDDRGAEVGDDTIDMAADVFVGRIAVRTEAQATAYVNKVLSYEKNQALSGFSRKMLLSGDKLWNEGDVEAKSERMWNDYIDPYWSGNRSMFYDTNTSFPGGADYAMSSDHINEQLGNGYNFFHMATHGGTTLWGTETGTYSSSHAALASNDGLFTNVLTIACWSNAFEKNDSCLGEAFIRNPSGGAVSYIGSSRYGWGYASLSSHGASFCYDRQFYKYLFTGLPSDYPQNIGAVFSLMKEYYISSSSSYGAYRWLQFSINLLGDPEMPLYTDDPQDMTVSHDAFISVGPQTYAVETGTPGALVCLMKGTEVYAYGKADGSGRFEAVIEPFTMGAMYVTVTAPNRYAYEGTCQINLGSEGMVSIKQDVATIGDMLEIYAWDTDLAGAGVCNVQVVCSSGDSENLSLGEIGSSTGVFSGTIQVAATPASVNDGKVQADHGQTIRVAYLDADGGNGTPQTVEDTALVDALAPAISNLQFSDIYRRIATVTFDTDEASSVVLRYGKTAGAPWDGVLNNAEFLTSYLFNLTELDHDSTYYCQIEVADEHGNTRIYNNGGAYYTFTTRDNYTMPFVDDFEEGHALYWEHNEAGIGDTAFVQAVSQTSNTISPYEGNYCAFLGNWTSENQYAYAKSTMDLVMDLSGHTAAQLDFYWACYSLDYNEYMRVDIYDGSWHEDVDGLEITGTEDWAYARVDLSSYNLIDGFIIRFVCTTNYPENIDAAYIDQVRVVEPDDLRVTPTREDFISAGMQGGPFTPVDKIYQIENIGSSSLDWEVDESLSWLSITPSSGTLNAGSSLNVTASIDASAKAMAGNYYPYVGSFTFRNVGSGEVTTYAAQLSITVPPLESIYYFSLDEDPGWATEGQWAFGQPLGLGGDYRGYPDPESGNTGENVYGINLAGDFTTTTLGPEYLTAGPFDFSGEDTVFIQFYRKLCCGYPGDTSMTLQVSNDGSNWVEIYNNNTVESSWGIGEYVMDYFWRRCYYDLTTWTANQSNVWVRWGHEISSDAVPMSGWNIDDIAFVGEEPGELEFYPGGDFESSGPAGGPFDPAVEEGMAMVARGKSIQAWRASPDVAWLDISPETGYAYSGEGTYYTISINEKANNLSPGVYTGYIYFYYTDDYNGSNGGAQGEEKVARKRVVLTVRGLQSFEWDTIESPQYVGVPFNATIRAVDSTGETITDFLESAELSAINSGVIIDPASTDKFTSGVWTGEITIQDSAQNLQLRAENNTSSTVNGKSNAFDVLGYHTITASWSGTGYIDPSGTYHVLEGASITFNILPDTGSNIASVMVDDVLVGAPGTYTFENVTTSHTISALFINGFPGVPSNPNPADAATGISENLASISCAPCVGATSYDIYIWKQGETHPASPSGMDLPSSSFNLPGALQANTVYMWQVVAKNSQGSTSGPEWRFLTGNMATPVDPEIWMLF
ncbi:MAG: C25 family cysteine peptidase [Candidatus Sumerlaeia bacterium]